MKALHIGTGYFPIVGGGLTRYATDLMLAQCQAGHEVSYFCSGDYDSSLTVRLRRWSTGPIRVCEVRNPRTETMFGGRQRTPHLELSEPAAEAVFRRILADEKPQVVHLHGLLGLPLALLDIVHTAHIPLVYTVQNYQALCPTCRLYDEVERIFCTDFAAGKRCQRCNLARPPAARLAWARRLPRTVRLLSVLRRRGARREASRVAAPRQLPPESAESRTFARRRQEWLRALNRTAAVVGMSRRVSEILVQYGVDRARVRTMHFALAHFDSLRPQTHVPSALPIRLAFLNRLTPVKGASLLLEIFTALSPDRAKLVVLGTQPENVRALFAPLVATGQVEFRGSYQPSQLPSLLSDVHLGLVPSVWEEPYGYVGEELLRLGIPVLGSNIGGIPDYVEHNTNGLLLDPGRATDWTQAIESLSNDPQMIDRLRRGIRAFPSFQEHVQAVENLYTEVLST